MKALVESHTVRHKTDIVADNATFDVHSDYWMDMISDYVDSTD